MKKNGFSFQRKSTIVENVLPYKIRTAENGVSAIPITKTNRLTLDKILREAHRPPISRLLGVVYWRSAFCEGSESGGGVGEERTLARVLFSPASFPFKKP